MVTLSLGAVWELPVLGRAFGPAPVPRLCIVAPTQRAGAGTLALEDAAPPPAARAAMSTTLGPPDGSEEPSFEVALAALRPSLLGFTRRRLGHTASEADVEDCVSETLRRALEGRAQLRDPADLSRWAFGIARHVSVDRQRRINRDWPKGVGSAEAASDDSPELDLIRARRSSSLAAALAELPERERQAILLFHAESKSYREIAELLAVPLGTVCTWIARARQRLEQRLKGLET